MVLQNKLVAAASPGETLLALLNVPRSVDVATCRVQHAGANFCYIVDLKQGMQCDTIAGGWHTPPNQLSHCPPFRSTT